MAWVETGAAEPIDEDDIGRVDDDATASAIRRSPDDVPDGLSTDGRIQLDAGFVTDHMITGVEHTGRFDDRTGQGKDPRVSLNTALLADEDGRVLVDVG